MKEERNVYRLFNNYFNEFNNTTKTLQIKSKPKLQTLKIKQ